MTLTEYIIFSQCHRANIIIVSYDHHDDPVTLANLEFRILGRTVDCSLSVVYIILAALCCSIRYIDTSLLINTVFRGRFMQCFPVIPHSQIEELKK